MLGGALLWVIASTLFVSFAAAEEVEHSRISYMGPNNSGLYSADSPSIAYNNKDNQFIIVWRGNNFSGSFFNKKYEIFAQRVDAKSGALVGTQITVSHMGGAEDPLFDAKAPHVVYNPTSNEYLIVWSGNTDLPGLASRETEIFGQRLNARTGEEVGNNDFRISNMGPDGHTSYAAAEPKVAYDSRTNNYLVVWSGDTLDSNGLADGDIEIFGQLLDSLGQEYGQNDFRISDMGSDGDRNSIATYPSIAFNSDSGEFLVIWRGKEDGQENAYIQRLDARNGAEIGLNDYKISDDGQNVRGVDVVYDSYRKRYLTTWISSSNRSVVGQFIENGFEAGENDFQISGNAHALAVSPKVSFNNVNKEFLLIWEGSDQSDAGFGFVSGDREVYGQLINSDTGLPVGDSSFQISKMGPDGNSFYRTDTTDIIYNPLYNEYLLTWAGTDKAEDLAPNEKEIYGAMLYKVEHAIDSDGDGVRNGRDADDDNDGLSDAEEATLGTSIINRDSDRDGIEDGQEILDGSDPLDAGSAMHLISTTVCADWNGFLGGMWNVAEHVNLSSERRQIAVSLDSGPTVEAQIIPGAQTDIMVNQMNGWTRDAYGTVCSSHDGNNGDVDGRMVYYKFAENEVDFAFAMPFSNGLNGKQYLPFNTFQPSLDPSDAENTLSNWIQLTSLAQGPQSGLLKFYSATGELLSEEQVSIEGRYDFPAHHLGHNLVGLVEWVPQSDTALFQLRNVRYFYDNPWGIERFVGATQVQALKGSTRTLVAPVDTSDGSAVLELSNTQDLETIANVEIHSASGELLRSEVHYLAPKATVHIIADTYLIDSTGSLRVKANDSIIAHVMHYGRNSLGGIEYLYGSAAKEALGSVLRGSYNTFLNQGCALKVVNSTEIPQQAQLSMTRYDGSTLIVSENLEIPANGSSVIDVCEREMADNYGVISLQSERSNSLFAEVVRLGSTYRFSTPLR